MNKRKKRIMVICIGIFAIVCLAFVGINLNKFGKTYTLEDYELKEFVGNASEYLKLSIDVESTDVEVLTADSDQIKISYYNMDKDYYTVSTAAGEIKMTYTNNLGSGLFGYSIPTKKITIELPKTVSLDMDYNIKYGNAAFYKINTDKEFKIKTDSVEVKLQDISSSQLNIEASYGEVELNDVNVNTSLNLNGKETRFNMKNIYATQFVIYNKEGKLNMEKIKSDTVTCETDSVTAAFTEMDCNTMNMTAKYGSITGSFVGNSKDYTVTGDVKDGKNNLSDYKGTGSKIINITADSASANILFVE